MRKYITCLIGILCIAFTSVCFAGRNEITFFSGDLLSVSVIGKDGKEYQIPGASGHIDLNTVINGHATVGEGKDLPNGEYTAIKYVFKNRFVVAGKVILDDGTEYGSVGGLNASPAFERGRTPSNFIFVDTDGSSEGKDDDGTVWCHINVSGDKYIVTQIDEDAHFTLDENIVKTFGVAIDLRYLWFGKSWPEFSSALYVKDKSKGETAGREDFTLDGNTITAPNMDPPEIIVAFN